MKFSEFDEQMRSFEKAYDSHLQPETFTVVRLDGRGFSKLTRMFQKPFDPQFYQAMQRTMEHLMKDSGLGFLYGHQHSDEISLLLCPSDYSFGGKVRKLNSLLASSASVCFSFLLQEIFEERIQATFDCRVCQLPTTKDISDYFRWRHADSRRNAINSYAYYALLDSGLSTRKATNKLHRATVDFKKELVQELKGIDLDNLPAWQELGNNMVWGVTQHTGIDPRTNTEVPCSRRELMLQNPIDVSIEFFTNLLGSA